MPKKLLNATIIETQLQYFRHIVRKRNSLEKNVMHMNEQKRSFLRVRSVDGLKSRKGAHHRNLSGSQSIIKS